MRKSLLALLVVAGVPPALGLEPGWHYSPLPGEGDRASLGCDRDADAATYTCLVVRCEDDFSTGIHVHTSRPDAAGRWEMTIDRENLEFEAVADAGPYTARLAGDTAPLLERLRQGSFVYLRPAHAAADAFAFIDLTGSLRAIEEALYWCAPRVPPPERNAASGVDPTTSNGDLR